jgi:phosphatidylinositol alpha-1,6-mannosyltransferase
LAKSLSILALVADAYGGHGGIAEYDRHLLAGLAELPLVSDVAIMPRRGGLGCDLPPKARQFAPISSRVTYSLAVLRNSYVSKPDIVFCGHLYMAPLALAAAKLAGAKLWLQVHGLEAWNELSGLHRRALSHATLVTSVSRFTRRKLLAWSDADPTKVKVLSNTLDPRFGPGPKPEHIVQRERLAGKKVLITVSRLSAKERYKGHDRVIAALPQVLSRQPETVYLIVGDGDDRPRLEQMASQLGLADAVRFVGHVAASELPDYFRAADVFLMPSTGEGFGIVLIEALACGVQVIAGNADGSADALADGALGKRVAVDDAGQLCDAIAELLRTPVPRQNYAARFARAEFAAHLRRLLQTLPASSDSSPLHAG